jgi:hypothetical protein
MANTDQKQVDLKDSFTLITFFQREEDWISAHRQKFGAISLYEHIRHTLRQKP